MTKLSDYLKQMGEAGQLATSRPWVRYITWLAPDVVRDIKWIFRSRNRTPCITKVDAEVVVTVVHNHATLVAIATMFLGALELAATQSYFDTIVNECEKLLEQG